MARIKDLWYGAKPDPTTGERKPTSRHGRGKRWLVEYRDPTGKIVTKSFDRKPDAKDYLTDVTADVQRGEYIDPRHGATKFRQVAEDWVAGRMVSPRTLAKDRRAVAKLVGQFGDYPINALASRPSLARKWLSARRTPKGAAIAPGTARYEHWVLTSIFAAAVDDDMARRNPMAKVKRPTSRRRKVVPWELETIQGLIGAHAEYARPIPWLAFGAGLRQGEAFGVAVEDIDFLRRTLTVNRQVARHEGRAVFAPPKFDSYGTVPLEKEIVELLAAYIQRHPPIEVELPWVETGAKPGETRTARLLATTTHRRPWLAVKYNQVHWHKALRSQGIEPAGKATGIHQLRHAFASYRLAEGVPITELPDLLRHKRLEEVVGTYAHRVPKRTDDRLKDAVASVFRPRSVPVPERTDAHAT